MAAVWPEKKIQIHVYLVTRLTSNHNLRKQNLASDGNWSKINDFLKHKKANINVKSRRHRDTILEAKLVNNAKPFDF